MAVLGRGEDVLIARDPLAAVDDAELCDESVPGKRAQEHRVTGHREGPPGMRPPVPELLVPRGSVTRWSGSSSRSRSSACAQ
jgi:hypothetical protein